MTGPTKTATRSEKYPRTIYSATLAATAGYGSLAVRELRQLFEFSFAPPHDFDVAAGGRFLVAAPVEQWEEEPTGVIVNWQEVIKQEQQ